MMKMVRILIATFPAVLVSACGSDGMDDLREFVRTAHQNTRPRVEPLPEVRTHEVFTYSAEESVDPFGVFNLKPRGVANTAGPRPDLHRRKEPLEDYPLDSLKMVGTLIKRKQAWVVVQAPDGTVHRAKTGNYMGQNFGKLVKITEDKVDLIELIQDPVGAWIERKASLSIEE